MAAGGSPACSAAEAVTSIWAFAVLGHTPTQLLQQLDQHGWVVKPEAAAAAAGGRSSSNQQQTGSATAGGSANSGSSSGGSSGGGLSALRDSQLCTLAWSLACLQQVDGGVFRGVWCEVCQRGPGLAGDVRQAVQLAQAALAIQLEGSYQPDELVPGEGEGGQKGEAWVINCAAALGVFAGQKLVKPWHCNSVDGSESLQHKVTCSPLCTPQAPSSCCQQCRVCSSSREPLCRRRRRTAATSAPLLARWHV